VKHTLSVLAATLVVAAGTGCAGDDGGSDAVGTNVQPTTPATTTSPTTEARTETIEPAETTDPGDASQTRPEPPPGQSRWARQVDAACKPWQKRLDAIATPTDAATLELFLAQAVPLARRQLAAVAAVKLPADDDEVGPAKLFVGALRQLERGLTRYLGAVRKNNAAAIQTALTDANAAGARARAYAASLNVTECGGYAGG
jgi:hypothetical protein